MRREDFPFWGISNHAVNHNWDKCGRRRFIPKEEFASASSSTSLTHRRLQMQLGQIIGYRNVFNIHLKMCFSQCAILEKPVNASSFGLAYEEFFRVLILDFQLRVVRKVLFNSPHFIGFFCRNMTCHQSLLRSKFCEAPVEPIPIQSSITLFLLTLIPKVRTEHLGCRMSPVDFS